MGASCSPNGLSVSVQGLLYILIYPHFFHTIPSHQNLLPNPSMYLSSFPSVLHALPTQTFTTITKPHFLHHPITVCGQIVILTYYYSSKTLSLCSSLKLTTQHKIICKIILVCTLLFTYYIGGGNTKYTESILCLLDRASL